MKVETGKRIEQNEIEKYTFNQLSRNKKFFDDIKQNNKIDTQHVEYLHARNAYTPRPLPSCKKKCVIMLPSIGSGENCLQIEVPKMHHSASDQRL